MRNDSPRWHLFRAMRKSPPDADALTHSLEADSAWLHGLARALSRDPEAAADAAQATLLAAWKSSPTGPLPRRGWLATTLRNALRQEARSGSRRRRREEEVSRPESQVPETTLERLEIQRQVLAAVAGLEEPYRTALVLRFLDGLSARAIARRLGLPTKTVYTHLERGLARLRQRLDRAHGDDRAAWMRALALVAPSGGAWIPTLTGAGAMGVVGKSTLGVAAALAVTAAIVLHDGEERAEARDEPSRVRVEEPPAPPPARLQAPAIEPRRELATPLVEPVPEAPPAVAPAWIDGVAVDLDQRPLAGLRIGLASDPDADPRPGDTVTTDLLGRFQLPWNASTPHPVCADPGWVELCTTRLEEGRGDARLILVPAVDVAGRVVDAEHLPVAGAEVRFQPGMDLYFKLGRGDQRDRFRHPKVTTDAEGRFRLAALPTFEGASLSARAAGYVPAWVDAPARDEPDLELVLAHTSAGPGQVEGRVVDERGRPFPGAWVSTRGAAIESDADGRFVVDLPDPDLPVPRDAPRGVTLRAAAAGYLPASMPLDPTRDPQPFVELRLDRQAFALAGVVVDAEGRPVAGASVWVNGLEYFGEIPMNMGGIDFHLSRQVEEVISPTSQPRVETDERGRFHLGGLREAEYELLALDPATQLASAPLRVLAGTEGLELALESGEALVRVAGRVEDRRGEPLSGVVVTARRDLRSDSGSVPPLRVTTGTDGRFAFAPLCADGLEVTASDEGSPNRVHRTLHGVDAGEDLVFVLTRPARFRLLVGDPDYAGATLRVEDGAGEHELLYVQLGEVEAATEGITLSQGTVGVVQVTDAARTIVLTEDGLPVVRIPIDLRPGEVREVHWP